MGFAVWSAGKRRIKSLAIGHQRLTTRVIVPLIVLWTLVLLLNYWIEPSTSAEKSDFIRTAATLVGGILLAVGLYVNWATLKNSTRSTDLLAESQDQTRVHQLSERFFNASQQLSSNSLHARLGALYSLESIANESDREYDQVCALIEAFLRERSAATQQLAAEVVRETQQRFFKSPEDIQTAITILGRRRNAYPNSESRRPNLSGLFLESVRFSHANFAECVLIGSNLGGAIFQGGTLHTSVCARSHFPGAMFFDTDLSGTNFEGANLMTAHFNYYADASLPNVHLRDLKMREALVTGSRLAIKITSGDARGATIEVDFEGAMTKDITWKWHYQP